MPLHYFYFITLLELAKISLQVRGAPLRFSDAPIHPLDRKSS